MIYIIEIPHQRSPKVWTGSNKQQIMDVIDQVSCRSGDAIYEEMAGRDLLDMYGYESTAEMREDNDALAELADLIDTHGLNTIFYKGHGDEEYSINPVDKWLTYLEYNAHDLSTQRVYMSDDEARTALADVFEWRIHQGIKARIALEKEIGDNNE